MTAIRLLQINKNVFDLIERFSLYSNRCQIFDDTYYIVIYYDKSMSPQNAHNMFVHSFIDTYIYKYKLCIFTE